MSALKPDLEQAKRFLKILDPTADMRDLLEGIPDGFTFQTFDDVKGRKDLALASILHGTFDGLEGELLKRNKKRAGVFVTINETDMLGRKLENITRVRAIWVEDDEGKGKPLPLEPHLVTQTSPGKYHKIILVNGLTPEQHLRLEEILITHYGSDPQAKDLTRVLRVPGFFHCKGEPFLVQLVHESGRDPYTAEEVMSAFDYENAEINLPSQSRSQPVSKPKAIEGDYIPISEDDKPPLPDITLENASIYLPPPGEQSRQEWLRVGMALHHQFNGSDEALQIWDEWSQQVREYQGFEDVAYNWRSFDRGYAGSETTFRHLVKEFNQRLGKIRKENVQEVPDEAQTLIESCDDYMTLMSTVAPSLWKLVGGSVVLEKDFSQALVKRYSELRPGHALTAKEAIRAMKARTPILTPHTGPSLTLDNPKTPYWARNWVWISTDEVFFHVKTRARITIKGFNAHFNSHLPKVEGEPTQAATFVLDSDLVPKVIRSKFLPGYPILFLDDTANNEPCVNAYNDSTRAKVPETPDTRYSNILKEHIIAFFGGWNREAILFCNFLKYSTAEVPTRVRWAPLLIGQEGDGKTVFHNLIQNALGNSNTRIVNGALVAASAGTGMTGWCEGSCFTSIEELKLHGHNKFDAMNVLKPYITNDTVSCRRMHCDPYDIKNVTNYMAFSNYGDGVPIQEGDRRYFVWKSKLDLNKLNDAYFNALFEAINEHTGDCIAWLRSVEDHADFKIHGPAPMTEAKQAVIKNLSDDFVDVVREALEESQDPYYCTQALCFKRFFDRLVVDMDGNLNKNEQYKLTRVLIQMGYHNVKRLRAGGQQHTVWVLGEELKLEDAKTLFEDREKRYKDAGLSAESNIIPLDRKKG
jgi:hypothetical protein